MLEIEVVEVESKVSLPQSTRKIRQGTRIAVIIKNEIKVQIIHLANLSDEVKKKIMSRLLKFEIIIIVID